MNRTLHILAALLLAPQVPLAALHAADTLKPATERKPNVVLILIDDFGYECVTANGGESYKTPVMDKLDARGKEAKAKLQAALKQFEGPRSKPITKQALISTQGKPTS